MPTAEGLESTADSGLRAGWLTLVGYRIPGAPDIPAGTLSETAPSPWGGMSGAVVVAGDLVIGVVRSHNLAAGGQSLTVTPLTAIDSLPAGLRRQFWQALGVTYPDRLPLLPDTAATSPGRVVELRGRGHLLELAGRDDELARLHVLLAGEQAAPVVLYGLGGVGKSQLAVEYAHARRDELSVVWMLRADDSSVLASDLAALGVQVGAADAAEPDIDVQLTAARSWLASHPGWLLIIDNVDDPAVLQAVHRLLPDTRLGRVIITSRIPAWPGRYHRLEITALDTDPAAHLLLHSIGRRRRAGRTRSRRRTRRAPAGPPASRRLLPAEWQDPERLPGAVPRHQETGPAARRRKRRRPDGRHHLGGIHRPGARHQPCRRSPARRARLPRARRDPALPADHRRRPVTTAERRPRPTTRWRRLRAP